MVRTPICLSRVLLAGHLSLTVFVMAVAMMLPRAGVPILVLPVTRDAARDLSGRLFDGKYRVVGPGPISGSFVVVATNERAWRTLVRLGVLPLAWSARWCGGPGDA